MPSLSDIGSLQDPTSGNANPLDFSSNQANINNLIARYEALMGGGNSGQQSGSMVQQRSVENPGALYDSYTGLTGLTARERNPFEQALTNAYRWGEDLMGITGWSAEAGFTPENIGKFLISLPFQMAGGFAMGPSQLYEGVSGQNILEGDENMALNYELDPLQRAGQIGNAAINTLALPFGGSARAIGAAGGLLTGGKLGRNLVNGWVSRAMPNASAGARFAAQTAFDTAEEASEEFAQSYMDDARWNSLDEGSIDRAILGAQWGALGGAAFSAGGQGVHAAATRGIRSLQQSATNNPTSSSVAWELQKNQGLDNSSAIADSVLEAQRKKDSRSNAIASSASIVNMMTARPVAMHQVVLGAPDIQNMWGSPVEGSRERLAKAWHTTVERLGTILSNRDIAEVTAGLRELIAEADARGEKITAAIGRNPDTNPQGSALVDVTDVQERSGVQVNRNAYSLFGMDQDGDKTQVYFDLDKIRTGGYMPLNLRSIVSGKTRLDPDYFLIHRNSEAEALLSDWLSNNGNNQKIGDYDPQSIQALFDAGIKMLRDGDGDGMEQVAHALDLAAGYYAARRTQEGIAANDARMEAGRAVGDLMFEMEKGASDWESAYAAAQEKARQASEFEDETSQEIADRIPDELWAQIGKSLEKQGMLSNLDAASVFSWQAGKVVKESILGNSIFRQTSEAHHRSDREIHWEVDWHDVNAVNSVFEAIMAYQFAKLEVGLDVETQIEGMFRKHIEMYVGAKLGTFSRIGDDASYNDFVDALLDGYAEAARIYNKCFESDTTKGERRAFLAPHKAEKIDGSHQREIARLVADVFGDINCETLFQISRDDPNYGITLSAAIKKGALAPAARRNMYTSEPGLNKLWNNMIADYGVKDNAVGTKIQDALREGRKTVRGIFGNDSPLNPNSGRKGWFKVRTSSLAAMQSIHNAFSMILGPTAMLDLNIHRLEGFVNSTWGKALLFGSEDQCFSTIVSIQLTQQYKDVITIFARAEEDPTVLETPGLMNYVEMSLKQKSTRSNLHAAIYARFITDHNLDFLKKLTSLDEEEVSWTDKERMYEPYHPGDIGKGTLIADACKSGDDEMALSAVSKRLTRASSVFKNAEIQSGKFARSIYERINNHVTDGTWSAAQVVSLLRATRKPWYVTKSIDSLAAGIYSGRYATKNQRSKSLSDDSWSSLYMATREQMQGSNLSYLDQREYQLGAMEVGNFQANRNEILAVLWGDVKSVRVWDLSRNADVELTQEGIFKEYGIDIDTASGPQSEQYLQLFEKAPALLTLHGPQYAAPISDGVTTSIRTGMDGDLVEWMEEQLAIGAVDEGTLKRNENRAAVQMELLNSANINSILVGMTDGIYGMSLTETRTAIADSLEKLTDYVITALAAKRSLTEDSRAVDRENAYVELSQVIRSVIAPQLSAMVIEEHLANAEEDMIDDLLATSMRINIENIISSEIDAILGDDLRGYKPHIEQGVDEQLEALQRRVEDRLGVKSLQDFVNENVENYLGMLVASYKMIDMESDFNKFMSPMLGQSNIMVLVQNTITNLEQERARLEQIVDSSSRGLRSRNRQAVDQASRQIAHIDGVIARLREIQDNPFDLSRRSRINIGSSVQEVEIPVDRSIVDALGDGLLDINTDFGNAVSITTEEEYNAHFAALKQKCENIVKTYNNGTDLQDGVLHEKDLEVLVEAFGKFENGVFIRGKQSARLHLARWYNGLALAYFRNRTLQGLPSQYNEMSLFQELEAQADLDALIDSMLATEDADLRSVIDGLTEADKVMNSDRPKVNFDDRRVAFMATQVGGNSYAGGVQTGISTDGAMMKYLAGFAFLPHNFLSNVIPAQQSLGPEGGNVFAAMMGELAMYFQEPMHLKFKKTMELALQNVSRLAKYTGLATPHTLLSTDPQTVSAEMLKYIVESRESLGAFLAKSYSDPAKKLGWSDNHFAAMAEVMTPFVEITGKIRKEDGSIVDRTIKYNVTRLSDGRLFDGEAGQIFQQMLQSGSPVGVKVVPVSLVEASAKILRHLDSILFSKDGSFDQGSLTQASIAEEAKSALENWEMYNLDHGKLNIHEIISGIPARGLAYDTAVRADFDPTAVQKWHQHLGHSVANLIVGRFGSNEIVELDARGVDSLERANTPLKKFLGIEDSSLVTQIFLDDKIRLKRQGRSVINEEATILSKYSKAQSEMTTQDGRVVGTAVLCVSNDPTTVMNAGRAAARYRRHLYLPKNKVRLLSGLMANDLLLEKAEASTPVASIVLESGETIDLVRVSARAFDFMQDYDVPQISQSEISDENMISWAVAEDEITGDGAYYLNPDHASKIHMYKQARVKVSSFLNTSDRVQLVTDPSEMFDIDVSPRSSNLDMSAIENDIRRDIRKRSLEDYMESVSRYIAAHRNTGGRISFAAKNVATGDCVGFIKSSYRGKIVYAPIFYEGAVPRHADTLRISLDGGYINFNISSTFDTTETGLKLNFDGIEYKSYGTSVPIQVKEIDHSMLPFLKDQLTSARYLFNAPTLASRVVGKKFDTVVQNLFYGAMYSYGSLFFDRVDGKFQLKTDLNPELLNGEEGKKTINSLMQGEKSSWNRVADGSLRIFDESSDDNINLNHTISVLARTILNFGGNPIFVLTPSHFILENGEFQYKGEIKWRTDLGMVFGRFNRDLDSILALYNKMNPNLCPKSSTADSANTFFDADGRIMYNGKRTFAVAGHHYFTGESTDIGEPSRVATWGYQHVTKRAYDLGVLPQDIHNLMGYLDTYVIGSNANGNLLSENVSIDDVFNGIDFSSYVDIDPSEQGRAQDSTRDMMLTSMQEFLGMPIYSERAQQHIKDCIDLYQAQNRPLSIKMNDFSKGYEEDPMAVRQVQSSVEKVNRALGFDAENVLSFAEVSQLVRHYMGFFENGNVGFNEVTVRQFTSAVDAIVKNINEGALPILGGRDLLAKTDTRVMIPLLPEVLSRHLYRSSRYSGKWDTFEKFVDAMYDELTDNSLPQIQLVKDPAKRSALYKMSDAMCYANGKDMVSGSILGEITIWDLMSAAHEFGTNLEGWGGDIESKYSELCQLNAKHLAKVKEAADARQVSIIPDAGRPSGKTVVFDASDKQIGTWILRELASTRMVMGLLHPMLTVGTIAERGINQGMMSAEIHLGQAGIGAYAGTKLPWTKGFDIKAVARNQDVVKLWSALRTAELNGFMEPLLARIMVGGDIDTAIEEVLKEQGAIEKFRNQVMDIVSGKNVFITGQIKNFLDYVALHAEREAPWLVMKDMDGMTVLERQLRDNPARFISDFIVGSSPMQSGSTIFARKALNWAKRGDMAQRNLVSAIYSEIARRSALVNFGTTALISPYFNYATNRLGRILQWIAPISSIHYILTQSASEGKLSGLHIPGTGKQADGTKTTLGDLGLESAQINMNLREAMAIDMMHLGPVMVAFVLVGTSGAVEPPEDEKKWCNFKEWTILGHRVDVAWWMEDILGLALPMACYMTSAMHGNPCPEVLVNGMAYYLSNNPVVKVSDAVSVLFDPMASLYRDYEDDLESYAKAMGGPPSFDEMVQGKMTSFGLSFAAQFITPLALRDIYNSCQQYQVSHRKIYEETGTGTLSEDAVKEGRTQYTTYVDAIIREQTKRNPVMGFLADVLLNGETGYMYHEMPRTVIYDPAQIDSYQMFSIYADRVTGEELPESEKATVGQAIIYYLQSHDVEDLAEMGFALDAGTRQYVGEMLWDMIADLNQRHYEMEQSGALDYMVAGNGDWYAGKLIVEQYNKEHRDAVNEIKDLYYNKLWNEDITGLQKYNQRHTTYAQDADGNWYATGNYPSWFTPITIAPSESPGDWQATMSRENDWATESVVTGESTGIRGLIPLDRYIGKTPSIDSYSSDGTDTGHSDSYNKRKGSSGSGSGSGTNGSGTTSGGTGRTYYRSGGSGGRSGGGGSTPNIYANYRAPNSSTPRTMDRVNTKDADYTYLRPNFETKGSREAYKRSDI